MQIHYFQRYHSKENVDTSNTMLMLSRLYNYNADKFFSMLNSLILGENKSPEITFDLQVVGDDSVPDAVISQKSFKIVVETKLYPVKKSCNINRWWGVYRCVYRNCIFQSIEERGTEYRKCQYFWKAYL